MSFDALLIHSVTITNTTPDDTDEVDRYGDPLPSDPVTVTEDARVQQLQADEDIRDRETRVTRYRAFLRPTSAITALSTVTWDGHDHRVVGDPWVVDGRSGPHHIEAALERVSG